MAELANPVVVGGLAILLAIEAVKLGNGVVRWTSSRRNGSAPNGGVERAISALRLELKGDIDRLHDRITKTADDQAVVNAEFRALLTALVAQANRLEGAAERRKT